MNVNSYLAQILFYIIGILQDYLIFKFISKIKFDRSYFLFLCWTFPTLLVINILGYIGSIIATILEITFFFQKYYKILGKWKIVGAIFLTNFISLSIDTVLNCLINLEPKLFTINVVNIILLALTILFILFFKNTNIFNIFDDSTSKPLAILSCFLFISLLTINFLIYRVRNFKLISLLFVSFIFIQYFVIFLLFYFYQRKQKEKKYISENLYVNNYIKILENENLQLREFKHDYKNILNSLYYSQDSSDIRNLISQLDIYSNERLPSTFFSSKDFTNIKLVQIKNLLIQKYNVIYQNKIKYSLNCKIPFDTCYNINIYDFVRIIGIAYDNAIEGSLNNDNANIVAFFTKNKDFIEFQIKNKIFTKVINFSNLLNKKSFSTKKKHQGIGLSNIVKINNYYPNMFLQLEIKDNWFILDVIVKNDQ